MAPVEGAPAVLDPTAPKRLVQMRAIAREFTASSHDAKGERWELRLLPKPLYRYGEAQTLPWLTGRPFSSHLSPRPGPTPKFSSGHQERTTALPAVVTRTGEVGFAPVSPDLDPTVQHKKKDVFSAPLIRGNLMQMYPKQEYRIFRDRAVPKVEGEAP